MSDGVGKVVGRPPAATERGPPVDRSFFGRHACPRQEPVRRDRLERYRARLEKSGQDKKRESDDCGGATQPKNNPANAAASAVRRHKSLLSERCPVGTPAGRFWGLRQNGPFVSEAGHRPWRRGSG